MIQSDIFRLAKLVNQNEFVCWYDGDDSMRVEKVDLTNNKFNIGTKVWYSLERVPLQDFFIRATVRLDKFLRE